jgi:hypothetical protein
MVGRARFGGKRFLRTAPERTFFALPWYTVAAAGKGSLTPLQRKVRIANPM